MYKIDKEVPIPIPTNKKKYPFSSMEIGDSFFVIVEDENRLIPTRNSILGSSRVSRYKDRKYTTKIYHGEKRGIRCWRIR